MGYFNTNPSNPFYADILNQTHMLIAGATGSGKSAVIDGICAEIARYTTQEKQMFLIDPKRVQLVLWSKTITCTQYACEPDDMVHLLVKTLDMVEQRYKNMQRNGLRLWNGPDVYVIVDELADLMLSQEKKTVQYTLQRIAQIGRAAKVHLILATQTPICQVIPTPIKCNLDSRLALRTRSAQDSRNILGFTGAELLPRYGKGIYMTADKTETVTIPYMPDAEVEKLVNRIKLPTR